MNYRYSCTKHTQQPLSILKRKLGMTEKQSIPIWFMRQAGRYLPEYQVTRKEAGGFLNLCFNPEKATEVTLQPIRRFNFDYAIIFSDILSIPHAMGLIVKIDEQKGGPLVETINLENIRTLKSYQLDTLNPVLEAIKCTRLQLPKTTKLIGFCGAPWTLAVYMLQGRSSAQNAETHHYSYRYRQEFMYLIDMLTDSVGDYLCEQIKAGCDTVQLFDSWASFLSPQNFDTFVLKPAIKIVQKVKLNHPNVTFIGFPRGAGLEYTNYAEKTKIDYIGCDTSLSVDKMRNLQKICGVQGNLDNYALFEGGDLLTKQVIDLKSLRETGPYIFNLGHGILPKTPIEHVHHVINLVRA
ncbi:MAG: uroporphyrinogen decarboxylase [Dasania sp.]|jgi:uroporphyrinogen decarboxylase